MAERPGAYTIARLHEMTGVTPRTIRFYISLGLLPPAFGRGPGARYGEGHLARLQLIHLLKSQHLPLDGIKQRLHELSDRHVRAMVSMDAQPIGERWRRVALHPGIELHIRERDSTTSAEFDDAIAHILDVMKPVIDRLKLPR
ncbi:MAG: MerR family transcriptional regulator [Thermomicrobiales bacterium]